MFRAKNSRNCAPWGLIVFVVVILSRWCDGSYLFQTSTPMIMTTWEFGDDTTDLAWKLLTEDGLPALDCVERGISETCELQHCDNSVGAYHRVDEMGDLSLDAMIMDGTSKVVGAVGNLKHVKAAISVARAVMKYTTHSFLTGQGATDFAEDMGFPIENLRTEQTEDRWESWKDNDCQPNWRQNVVPDPTESCGPYSSPEDVMAHRSNGKKDNIYDPSEHHHDTIGQLIIDENLEAVVGLSTSGMNYKVPGRVGDSPIPGAGGYALSGVGAAAATGDGDIILRFMPTFDAVTRMERGDSPDVAVMGAVLRVKGAFPDAELAVILADHNGRYSAACFGFGNFKFVVRSHEIDTTVMTINCEESLEPPSRS